jgi:hypothetical protein
MLSVGELVHVFVCKAICIECPDMLAGFAESGSCHESIMYDTRDNHE